MKRNNPKNQSTQNEYICIALLTAVCILSLLFTALDCEKYKESSAACAITFTPPEEQAEKGFWDIVADSLSLLLSKEG